MSRIGKHREFHRTGRIGWLRAAVLGANDGLLSTASLVLGVAAAKGTRQAILLSGLAGLTAGAMSMAAGEYVSVSSQADVEAADLARERAELLTDPAAEQQELAAIYMERGLTRDLAEAVSAQLMQHNAIEAHARDELGITETMTARPLQAALASAASFAAGAAVPLLIGFCSSPRYLMAAVGMGSLCCLALLGTVAARAGGANVLVGAFRVVFWGVVAMLVTFGIGTLAGTR